MPQEVDLRFLPAAAKDVLTISLGAAWKSYTAALKPAETLPAMLTTAKQLITLPADAPGGLQGNAEALAGVWMDKGLTFVDECKAAGQKFTEGRE